MRPRSRMAAVVEAEDSEILWESCRGGQPISFKEAVLAGWAPDGGMLWPNRIPKITNEELRSWMGLSYHDISFRILRKWISPSCLGDDGLWGVLERAFARFAVKEVVTHTDIGKGGQAGHSMRILELWHGPTLAFKDLGMSVLSELIQHFLREDGDRMILVVGTSGDTGPSALESVRGADDVLDCVVLYPIGRVSRVQEGQMIHAAATSTNAHVVAVEGTSDDLDVPCEAVFRDEQFKQQHRVGTVNSVNIARLLVQTIHFFYGYLSSISQDIEDSTLPPVDVSIPSGAAGHLTAAILAKEMGLKLNKIVVATNENRVLDVLVREGILQKQSDVVKTNSNAMDIQVPYNYERILYHVSGRDSGAVSKWVRVTHEGGRVNLPETVREGLGQLGLISCSVGQGREKYQVLSTIQSVFSADQYLLDPHTAVGVAALRDEDQLDPSLALLVMGCAHAAKFPEVVAEVVQTDASQAIEHLRLTSMGSTHRHIATALSIFEGHSLQTTTPMRFEKSEDWESKLRELIEQISANRALQ